LVLTENLRGAGFMGVAMAAFTMGDACVKAVAEIMPLYQAITIRGLVTIVAMTGLGIATGGLALGALARGPGLRIVTIRSLAEVAATITFFAALMALPLATLSAIMQSVPLAITMAAALFMNERVGWRRLTAIAVGFAGVLLIIRPGAEGFSIWALFGLASVAAVVVRDLSSRRLPPSTPSVTVALCAAVLVTITAAVLSLRTPWQPVTPQAVLLILAAAFFVIVGYIFVIRVMRVGEVSFTAPFRYTALLWAVLLGWIFFDEWPDAITLLGGAIVVASGLFTLARERKVRRGAPPPPQPPLRPTS
jgi:drug/metabolite transporter (DMT)-like permease